MRITWENAYLFSDALKLEVYSVTVEEVSSEHESVGRGEHGVNPARGNEKSLPCCHYTLVASVHLEQKGQSSAIACILFL